MTLSQFESLIMTYVPGAQVPAVLTQATLDLIINKGVEDVNQRLKVFRKHKTFNLIANKSEYDIFSDVANDFCMMDESGIYYYDGTYWQQLFPKTRKWLDDNVYNWRSYAATNKPQYYVIENNSLILFSPYSADLTDGGLIHYIANPVSMSNGDHYPWTGSESSHLTELDCLDDAIIAYAQWKLSQPLGQKANGVIDQATYMERLQICDTILRSRIDMSNSRYFRMRGPYGWSGSGSR